MTVPSLPVPIRTPRASCAAPRTRRSPSGPDPLHYVGEVLVILRIIAALCLDTLLGWPAADPTLAMVITVYLLYNGGRLADPAGIPRPG